MSNTKETPRQKMISLMYLILTCLLALNVSREVLDGFVTINDSIETTNKNYDVNTKKMLEAVNEAISQGRNEFKPYLAKSEHVMLLTQNSFGYIDSLKKEIINYTEDTDGADTLKLGEVEKLDDYDKPTYFLIGDDETQPKKGKYSALELKQTISNLSDSLNAMLDGMKDKKGLMLPDNDFNTLKKRIKELKPQDNYLDKEGLPQSWEMKNFYNQPLAAVITNLSKIQGDLRNIEGEMISAFAAAPGKLSVKFDLMQARIVPVSQYLQSGSPYTADVFLSATSSDFKEDNLQFILGEVDTVTGKLLEGAIILPIDSGAGKINLPTSATGDKEIKGWIKFRDWLGNYKYYRYQNKYTVANAAVAVSPDNMNLFYAGVDNPLTVSAAGVAPQHLEVKIDGCEGKLSSQGNGKYTATVKGTGKCTVTVYQRNEKGLQRQGAPQVFRVKKVPNPLLRVNSKTVSGNDEFALAEARNIRNLTIDNSNFEFNAPFEVISFTLFFGGPRLSYDNYPCEKNEVSQKAREALQRMQKGGTIYIEDILIKAPDGPRKLPPVKIKVK